MIHMTENAAKRIGELKSSESDPENKFLRVRTSKGGCSGLSYKLEFDTELTAKDKVFEGHGQKVVVDAGSYLYLIGMTLDFDGGLNGQGFTFSNPNASKTCGCGSSFAV